MEVPINANSSVPKKFYLLNREVRTPTPGIRIYYASSFQEALWKYYKDFPDILKEDQEYTKSKGYELTPEFILKLEKIAEMNDNPIFTIADNLYLN